MFETLRSTVRFRRFRFGRATRQLDRAANVMDLRAIAKRRLPGGVFDYIDGAAEDERSLARSMTAFADIEFKPRVLRDVSEIDTTTTLLGEPMAFPFIAAPTGFTRIAHSEGELAVARAAGLICCHLDGSELRFNKPDPWSPGLVIARPGLVDQIVDVMADRQP